MRALRIAAAFLGAASLAACSDRPEPIEPIGATILRLRIVAGDERPADTILTRRTLVVEARDRRGRLVSNVPVVAYSGHLQLSDPAARATAPAVLFGRGDPLTFDSAQRTVTTDARGRARFELALGSRAGEASVVATMYVVDGSVEGDSMHVTILPGAPAGVRFATSDTVVMRGRTFSLGAAVRDRGDNVLPGAVPLAFPADTFVSAGAGQLRAERTGRARVVASYGAWRDTATVAVVPAGVLTGVVAADHTGDVMRLVTVNTDGTGMHEVARVTTTFDMPIQWWVSPSWVPSAERIVTATPTTEPRLVTYALDGTARPLVSGATRPPRGEIQPRASRDGAWLWFTGLAGTGGTELWRVRADGSDAARVGPASTTSRERDERPAPSPDGQQVAIATTRGSFPFDRLAIVDVATGDRRVIATEFSPSDGPWWSPDGTWLLYRDPGNQLHLVHPDGSDDHWLFGNGYSVNQGRSFAWSPDGKWIVGHDGLFGLRLIEVATQLELRIPGTREMYTVDWAQ